MSPGKCPIPIFFSNGHKRPSNTKITPKIIKLRDIVVQSNQLNLITIPKPNFQYSFLGDRYENTNITRSSRFFKNAFRGFAIESGKRASAWR
jgi:hypothetical protein